MNTADTKMENSLNEPSSSKVKRAYMWGVTGLLILFVGLILLAVLNYFRIVDLSSIKSLSFLPQGEQSDGGELTRSKSFYDVTARSERPGYEIVIHEKEELIKLLTRWSILGARREGGQPVTQIHIILSNASTPSGLNVENKSIGSLANVLPSGVIEVTVYLSDQIAQIQEDSSRLNEVLQLQVLQQMYTSVYGAEPLGTEESKDMVRFINAVDDSNIQFVTLQKI